jgi:hypothetical protein
MMRASSKQGYFAFMASLRKEFSKTELASREGLSGALGGMVLTKDAKSILASFKGDTAAIDDFVKPFLDSSQNNILWPELLAFLSCCSNWCTIKRLHSLDLIRRKQGKS